MAASGHQVFAVYRRCRPVSAVGDASTIRWLRADLADALDQLPIVDAIIHAAAHTHLILDSVANDYIRSNVIATQRLTEYARRAGVGLVVHLSTMSVYGDTPPGELTEATPFANPSLYGTTKYLSELVIAENSTHFSSVNLRLPGVVAPGYFTPWVGQVVRKALEGSAITIYNPHAPFNNIVDVEELARFVAHTLAMASGGARTINFAASDPMTVRDVVETILAVTGSRAQVNEDTARKGSFFINIDRLRRSLGFEPASTRNIVARYAKASLDGRVRLAVPTQQET